MFSELSVLTFLIYAAGIGFAFAIIYTNIQRTAFSKFICFLLDNNCFDESSAVSLSEIMLSSLQCSIIKSAVKKHYGFKRCIKSVCNNISTESNSDEFFSDSAKNNEKYFISDNDIENLRKKYSYKTMPTRLVVLFIASLIVVVVVFSYLVNIFMESISAPKLENNGDTDTNITESDSDNGENSVIGDDASTSSEDLTNDSDTALEDSLPETNEEKPTGPRIPV